MLPHGFVRPLTDSLWTRRRALHRGTDYLLDPLRGEVRVLATMAAGETLWVSMCWLTLSNCEGTECGSYSSMGATLCCTRRSSSF